MPLPRCLTFTDGFTTSPLMRHWPGRIWLSACSAKGRSSCWPPNSLLVAEQLAAKHGKARMGLTTARTNLPAQAAYEGLGWVRDEVYFSYSKDLPSSSKAR